MKTCPTCKKTYDDDSINFCLDDGATLLKKRAAGRKPASRTNEVLAVALLAFAVLVFLCLVSFNQSDPTFNTASSQKVQNWIGVVGANFAELLMSLVGITAYLLPALLGLIAWRVFKSASLRPKTSRVVGFVLFVASVAGISSLFGWHGGLVGAFFSYYAVYLLSRIGAGILMFTTLIGSTLVITNVSFAGLIGHFELAWENLMVHFNEWRSKRQAARADQHASAIARSGKRKVARVGKLNAEPPSTIAVGETAEAIFQKAKGAAAGGSVAGPYVTVSDPTEGRTTADPVIPTIINTGKPKDDETIPDTIASNDLDGLARVNGKRASKNDDLLDVPIKPKRSTTDLDEFDLPDMSEEDESDDLPAPKKRAANYGEYSLPPTDFLHPADAHIEQKAAELQQVARDLSEKTSEFNVAGKVMHILPGPVVTTYEFKPDPGVK
ncbi:MAG: hypothetical protein HOP17_03800, partial [Acidobacteria bacterium]|nr:hypothetical protein [Acidobacteriota bacterium]